MNLFETGVERDSGTFRGCAHSVSLRRHRSGNPGTVGRPVPLGTGGMEKALAPFRLPIDRVFSVDGFGIVVTGTPYRRGCPGGGRSGAGSLAAKPGADLQVHSERWTPPTFGQRAALNPDKSGKNRGPPGGCGGMTRQRLAFPDAGCAAWCLRKRQTHGFERLQIHSYHGDPSIWQRRCCWTGTSCAPEKAALPSCG